MLIQDVMHDYLQIEQRTYIVHLRYGPKLGNFDHLNFHSFNAYFIELIYISIYAFVTTQKIEFVYAVDVFFFFFFCIQVCTEVNRIHGLVMPFKRRCSHEICHSV